VIEIGAGTGLNARHYEHPRRVVLVEPDAHMRARLEQRLAEHQDERFQIVPARAEQLPFPAETFDAAVSTLVLCSVARVGDALAEIHRVLRCDGRLVVIEHVRAEGALGRAQDLLASPHRLIGGGCTPNRRTAQAIRAAGFAFEPRAFILAGNPDPLTRPAIEGIAVKQTGRQQQA
jgi:ubiquinone/menaquinone biosynthesis C-methylase UbiE